MKIGFLGPEGSYTHIAALDVFTHHTSKLSDDSAELIGAKTITDLIEDLQEGKLDKAIVPIENSIAGSVNETTDALLKSSDIYINNEYTLDINHCLLSPTAIDQAAITNVHAHTMSFGQCRDYLRKHCPNASREMSASNSKAAAKVAEHKREGHAAIAPELCAKLYDLELIAKSINDEDNNQTRFWVLSNAASEPTGNDKTSIVFQTVDEPGSLERILKHFAEQKINLTRLESRPQGKQLGTYSFCVDLVGHKEDDSFTQAIKDTQKYFSFYKLLGSYSALN